MSNDEAEGPVVDSPEPQPEAPDTEAQPDRASDAESAASSGSSSPRRAAGATRSKGGLGVRWRQLMLTLFVGAVVVALATCAATYMHARQVIANIQRSSLLPTSKDRPAFPEGAQTFLIMGADSRDYDPSDPGRSDTMMLAYVPKDRKHVYLISITRDMWVPIHDGPYAKINAAYARGGAALTVQTLEDMFGMGINHVALMDFDGFMQLTNTLGGVQVWNDTAFEDSANMGCEFGVGWVTVKGDCGLAYVRERHNSPDGDLGRAERQRAVVKAIVAKAISAGVMTNPVAANKMMDQVGKTFTIDDQMTDDDLLSFATSLKIGSSSDIRSMQLPIGGYDVSADGQDINVPDEEALAELALAMRSDTMDRYWATHDPSVTMTDNPAWPPGRAPYGTPSPRPTVPLPTAQPTATRNTDQPTSTHS